MEEILTTLHPGVDTSLDVPIPFTIMRKATTMRLRFIGLNGSMGLHFGQVYRVTAHPWHNGVRITSPVICPYDTDKGFWQNWAHPDEELRIVMESKGRELRKIHIRREFENTPIPDELPLWRCTRSEIHGSHNWQTLSTEKPYAWCPGKTDKEHDEILEHLASGVSDGAQGEDRADQGLGVHGVGTPVAEARRILGRDGADR